MMTLIEAVQIKKVLVITLSIGEPQLKKCIESVKIQQKVECSHEVISNLPNVPAHKKLYEIINTKSAEYDYFIKLDADMEFSSDLVVFKLLSSFDESTDHLTIPVFDHFIFDDMPELHVFSNRVQIDVSQMNELRPDLVNIKYPGSAKKILDSNKFIHHCRNPDNYQSLAFGYHRCLKILQRNNRIIDVGAARAHYITLCKVHDHYVNCQRTYLKYALYGAFMAIENETVSFLDNKAKLIFNSAECEDTYDFRLFKYSYINLGKIVGFSRLFLGGVYYLIKKASFGYIKK